MASSLNIYNPIVCGYLYSERAFIHHPHSTHVDPSEFTDTNVQRTESKVSKIR